MRRMIPQKLIDKLVARIEREEQTKEMLKNITVQVDEEDIIGYTINLSSDGETYLTITGNTAIEPTDECTIELDNIPTKFLSKLKSAGEYPGANSLGGGDSVFVQQNNQEGYITLTFSAGEQRTAYFAITLSSVLKDF